jgi:hypothetical protein
MSDQGEFKGTYGASQTPCRVFYVGQWYAIEGSVNVNKAPFHWVLPARIGVQRPIDVELIVDTDTSTASHPINSIEDLQNHLSEEES